MTRATVITDASFDYGGADNFGAWAAWVRIDRSPKPIKGSGLLKSPVRHSTDAEIYAALNGIWLAVQHGATNVLLQTDCLTVVRLVNRPMTKVTPMGLAWAYAINSAGLGHTYLQARHVKGHSGTGTKRTFVQDWCDREAGRHMRKARRAHRKKRIEP